MAKIPSMKKRKKCKKCSKKNTKRKKKNKEKGLSKINKTSSMFWIKILQSFSVFLSVFAWVGDMIRATNVVYKNVLKPLQIPL